MRLPEFFIVGGPKSGTTFLAQYLSEHPDIYMPERKELHYFGSDLQFTRGRISFEQYASHFRGARAGDIVGEASVWYLYSTRAAREIKEFCRTARIIIMLRNPPDMLWSLHSQMLYTLNEEIDDFEAALAAEEDRRDGRRVPPTAIFPAGLLYTEVARLTPQVRRYLHEYPKSDIHIVLFDDLKRDSFAVLAGVFQFLGLSDWRPPSLEVVNPATTYRSRLAHRLLQQPPAPISVVGRLLSPRLKNRVIRALRRLNTERDARGPMPQRLRRAIGPRFEDDVVELQQLIGRDLSGWIESWRDG